MTPRPHHYGAALFGFAFLGLSACDSQASTDYQGEALLTLKGSVEIGETSIAGELIPALAFFQGEESISIVDVDVSGMFPSNFTLNVFAPPPAGLIGDVAPYAGEVQGAWGFITAAPLDHAPTFPIANSSNVVIGSDGAGGIGGDGSAGAGGGGPCPVDCEWCTASGECRREHYVCENQAACNVAPDNGFLGCTLTESEGDPELSVDVFERFAGMSENYVVLYLEQEAPIGSWAAHFFSDDGAIPAGYSLIEITQLDESPGQAQLREQCEWLAEDTAVQRLFEMFGGSVPREQIADCDWLQHEESPPSFCADFEHQYERALAERDCPMDGGTMRRVHDTSNTPIHVRIGKNLGFGSGGN